jgi:hypothetical protein
VRQVGDLDLQVKSQWQEFRGFWKPGQARSQEEKEEHLKRLRKQAKENRDAIAAILDPAQKARLKQIGWQFGGVWTFNDPEVIAKLELTTDQIDRIREIQDQARKEQEQCHRPPWDFRQTGKEEGTKADRVAVRKKIGEIWQTAQARIMSQLTPAQSARWRELVGEPFKGQMMFPPAPPHHRGHRPDGVAREEKGKRPPQE